MQQRTHSPRKLAHGVPERQLVRLGVMLGGVGLVVALATVMWTMAARSAVPAVTASKLSSSDAAALRQPHAPKVRGTAPQLGSCPRAAARTGLYTGDNGGFQAAIANEAIIAPTSSQPFEYIVFAGSPTPNAPGGLLIVVRLDADPCAPAAAGTQVRYFTTPGQLGSARLIAIAGTLLSFTNARGGSGHFDCVSGAFTR